MTPSDGIPDQTLTLSQSPRASGDISGLKASCLPVMYNFSVVCRVCLNSYQPPLTASDINVWLSNAIGGREN